MLLKSSEHKASTNKTVAIIGTRGIPNSYGGFEYFAEHLSVSLVNKGYQVLVLEPTKALVKLENYQGVVRIPIKVSKLFPHAIRKIIYGCKSLKKAKRINADAIICCGYTPALFFIFYSKSFRKKIIVNLDGIEWKRAKWNFVGKLFLRLTEYLSVKWSGKLVADNKGIKDYILKKHGEETELIAYGVNIPTKKPEVGPLTAKGLTPNNYGLTVARIEPENQIELIIKSFITAGKTLVIVGGLCNRYAKTLHNIYSNLPNVVFWGAEYNSDNLLSLRSHANLYVHGHTVGGTNPSLLEAMACGCKIAAHNNMFNHHTLDNTGLFFDNERQLSDLIENYWNKTESWGTDAKLRAAEQYSWEVVTNKYIGLIENATNKLNKKPKSQCQK
jgi:glycosyltransferase involved in cell wall biosynthesis